MKTITALMLAASLILNINATAKKTPPPPPNLAASVKVNFEIEAEVTPPAAETYDISTNLAYSHSFEITTEQEAALQADTKIGIMGTEFLLSEDTNFENGDKSATIEKTVPAPIFSVEVPVKISVKWNKGKMTVSVKGKLKETDVLPPVVEARTKSVNPREPFYLPLFTNIEPTSIAPFTIEAVLTGNAEISQTEGATAEGTEYMKVSYDIQSAAFATEVPF